MYIKPNNVDAIIIYDVDDSRYLDVVAVGNFMKILKFWSANTLFYAQNISYLSLEILSICEVAFCKFSSHACIALYLVEVRKNGSDFLFNDNQSG